MTFCIVQLSPSPGIGPCQPCPTARRDRGETAPATATQGPQATVATSLWLPTNCPRQQDETGSKRRHPRPEPVPGHRTGGEQQPLGSAAPATGCGQHLAHSGSPSSWQKMERGREFAAVPPAPQLFRRPRLPCPRAPLQPRRPPARRAPAPAQAGSAAAHAPESLSGRPDGKQHLWQAAAGRAAVMSARSEHGIAYGVQQRGVRGAAPHGA